MWENARNLTILMTGLITADIAIVNFSIPANRELLLVPFLLPIMASLYCYAGKDLEHEFALLFYYENLSNYDMRLSYLVNFLKSKIYVNLSVLSSNRISRETY
jgi:hypothetical protein